MAEKNLPLKYVSLSNRKRITTIDSTVLGFDSLIIEILAKTFLCLFLLGFILEMIFNPDSYLKELMKVNNHDFLIVFFVLGLIALVVGVVLSKQKTEKDNQLKIIEASDNGIRVGAGKFDQDRSFFLSWNVVNAVEAVIEPSTKEHCLVISTSTKRVYEFKWDNAFAWIDEESFFSSVKSSASHAKFNWDIDDVKAKDKLDSRYTNLWLHYFSAPTNRQRKGHLEVGTTLQEGLYQVDRILGGGGQGMAYVATFNAAAYTEALAESSNSLGLNPKLNDKEQVVLKEYILPVYRGNDIESKKYTRLSSEAKILSGLNHEQVVKLYDCFIEDHRGYMVLEYILGQSLSELVKEKGPLSEIEAANCGLSILNILDYIHGQSSPIIHRDLSPDNFMITDERSIKLLDFTVAQESNVQRTAAVVGKQSYISPEQFRGSPVIQSDIYSFGCTLFYLLTGLDPKPMEVESIRESNPSLNQDLDMIIQKATAFELPNRYSCASEMSYDLKFWLESNS